MGRTAGYAGTPSERLSRNLVRQPNGCLEWQGALSSVGYGQMWVDGKQVSTHRVAWALVNGPIPPGVVIRHFVCDNPPCGDVNHLRDGTQADNVADMDAKGRRNRHPHIAAKKTHCPQGHPYSGKNLYVAKSQKYACRICRYAAVVRWRAKT